MSVARHSADLRPFFFFFKFWKNYLLFCCLKNDLLWIAITMWINTCHYIKKNIDNNTKRQYIFRKRKCLVLTESIFLVVLLLLSRKQKRMSILNYSKSWRHAHPYAKICTVISFLCLERKDLKYCTANLHLS